MSTNHKVVSRDEWIKARKALLAKEKAATRQGDQLSAERRELPWLKVEKNYVFEGPEGKETLSDLFDGRSQLIVYHFMFGEDWSQGCPGCSFVADHYNPAIVHVNHRDATMVTISRAPLEKLLKFRERMGWTFKWLSSQKSDFNRDFHVSFTEEELKSDLTIYNYDKKPEGITEMPGLSVFFKNDAGEIFHTYSTYARGLEIFLTTYHLIDALPKGRDEETIPPMSWVRHHDRYEKDENFVMPWEEAKGKAVKA